MRFPSFTASYAGYQKPKHKPQGHQEPDLVSISPGCVLLGTWHLDWQNSITPMQCVSVETIEDPAHSGDKPHPIDPSKGGGGDDMGGGHMHGPLKCGRLGLS